MAAGATYEPIANNTLGSAVSTVTFSSISGSYTDLIIIANIKSSVNSNIFMQFNSDTATNYSRTILSGTGSSVTSARNSNIAKIYLDYNAFATTNFDNTKIIQIMNYSKTTTNKTCLVRSGTSTNGIDAIVGMWRNTAAITSILLTNESGNFSIGSSFTLYGIVAA